ncbi:MAG: hypothetical protein AB8B91_14535 [Rubripirellula sp.]
MLKRFLLACVALVLITFVIGLLFLVIRSSQAEAKIDAIQAAGDPVSLSDLEPTGVTTTNNMATYLQDHGDDADALVNETLETLHGTDFDWVDGLPEAKKKQVERSVAKYPDLFGALDLASQCTRCDCGLDYSVPINDFSAGMLQGNGVMRTFARVSDIRTRSLAMQGKYDEAAASSLTQLRICRAQDELPTLFGLLLNIACRQGAMNNLNALLQEVKLSEATHAAIETELAQHDAMEMYVDALKSERACGIEMIGDQLGLIAKVTGMLGNYLDVMQQEIDLGAAEHHKIQGYQPVTPMATASMLTPAIEASRKAMERSRTLSRAIRVLNEIKRRENLDSVPVNPAITLAELGLAAEAITDPYTGRPLISVSTDEGWMIYGVGDNLVDDAELLFHHSDDGLGPVVKMPE